MSGPDVEGLLRELAPRALGVVVRRYGDFADAEDAVQQALVAGAQQWPADLPTNPLGWLVTVASRRLVDEIRSNEARRRREDTVTLLDVPPEPSARDDSLVLLFLCCHDALSPTLAIPLTLRAVAGLTTREIAAAYLVPEATMAQRISRAKAKLRGERFALPEDLTTRLRSVLEVLYLLFNEGYVSSSGPDLARTDLSGEAIRLTRMLHEQVPDNAEAAGLLALMLLTDARRPARTASTGRLVPLTEQDRKLWDRSRITEGMVLLTAALQRRAVGEYQLLACIAGLHDQAPSYAQTQWAEIASLYGLLEQMTGNPVVTLNRAVALAMVEGPQAGLKLLDGLHLGTHRLYAVRAHLLQEAGEFAAAAGAFRVAAALTTNVRERDYLTMRAAASRRTS
ncbi:MAG: RNA polymerase sigma factor [Sporichthyaceae bacterium]|nr:RNA polymerase sigma factor [Sporichthyaceae bacterium]